eukprot:SAG11_NODE_4850_length_1747_cov_0.961772_1_plen_331_part_00
MPQGAPEPVGPRLGIQARAPLERWAGLGWHSITNLWAKPVVMCVPQERFVDLRRVERTPHHTAVRIHDRPCRSHHPHRAWPIVVPAHTYIRARTRRDAHLQHKALVRGRRQRIKKFLHCRRVTDPHRVRQPSRPATEAAAPMRTACRRAGSGGRQKYLGQTTDGASPKRSSTTSWRSRASSAAVHPTQDGAHLSSLRRSRRYLRRGAIRAFVECLRRVGAYRWRARRPSAPARPPRANGLHRPAAHAVRWCRSRRCRRPCRRNMTLSVRAGGSGLHTRHGAAWRRRKGRAAPTGSWCGNKTAPSARRRGASSRAATPESPGRGCARRCRG